MRMIQMLFRKQHACSVRSCAVLGLVMALAVVFGAREINAQTKKVLILSTTMYPSGTGTSINRKNEEDIAIGLGFTVHVATPTVWGQISNGTQSLPFLPFNQYDAIIFGDPGCPFTGSLPVPQWSAANNFTSKPVWSAAVQGHRCVLIGTDTRIHESFPSPYGTGISPGGGYKLMENAIRWVANGNGTGLYLCLSCYYKIFPSGPLDIMSNLTSMSVQGQNADGITIVDPAQEIMKFPNLITAADLSPWGESMHEFFPALPVGFTPVVSLTAGNKPYIVVCGDTCKHHCGAEWESPYCLNTNTLVATMMICNDCLVTQTYSMAFAGVQYPGLCSGPLLTSANFTGYPTTVTVQPGQCLPVPVTISKPVGLSTTQHSCYTLTVTNLSNGHISSCDGSVILKDKWCWKKRDGDATEFQAGQSAVVGFEVENTGDADGVLPYKISVMGPGMTPDMAVVRLNGLPPGTPVEGVLNLPVGQSTKVAVEVEFLKHVPFAFFDLLVSGDENDDGDSSEVIISHGMHSAPTHSPVPTVSEWGLVVLLTMLVGTGGWLLWKRHRSLSLR
ncbi:MAG: hypothetical protein HY033_09225 [Ignavibacteriae bacterium]|nr:hypothetical protein [Ignavibacteria bacterium]MBI3365073.1 hypothetical protein [Ignavibacteriota bacterium]